MRAWHWCVMGLIATAAPAGLAAQDSAARRMPAATRICDMSMRVVSLQLATAAGAPIGDARIVVRRVRTRATLAGAEAMGDGDYKVIEDGTLSDLRPGGEPFDVTFTKGARTKRVRLIIGLDAGRCHVMLKGGPVRVRM